jgi:2-polyprenyl-3-methyl-5-hydroxy-6-metoxy-1,4-benzoquinol methylase
MLSPPTLTVKSNFCRLCSSELLRPVMRDEWRGQEYHVVRCATCDLVQTLEHYAAVSPDYIDLDDGAIDDDRLWCQGAHKQPAFQQWRAAAGKFLDVRDARLLDVGCGTGGFLDFAAGEGFRVYGFDASRAQAARARQRFPDVRQAYSPRAYLAELGELHLKFEIITLWDVLEHIRSPQPLLEEAAGVLNPGGCLFVSVPNGRAIAWKSVIYRIMRKRMDLIPWEHVFYYSPSSLRRCMQLAPFEVLKIGAVACYPRPLSTYEVCRRAGFKMLQILPGAAPQIFSWARRM